MSDERNWFEKLTVSLENHKLGVQFQRFVSPKDIPASFIQRQMKLSGRVIRIDPSSGNIPTTLIVDHYPVISFRRSATDGLPVQISSIDLSSNAISWLQHMTVGKEINFRLLKASPHCVSCIVTQNENNVGVDLVSLGFASVSTIDFTLQKDQTYLAYYKRLLASENRAEKRGVGMWAGEASNFQIFSKIMSKVTRPVKNVLHSAANKLTRKRVPMIKNI